MTATLMDGRALAAKVRAGVAQEVQGLGQLGLATVLVGDDPASHVYVASKHKAASEAGIEPHDHKLPPDTSGFFESRITASTTPRTIPITIETAVSSSVTTRPWRIRLENR